MDMTGERRIPAPRQKVWDALNDPEVLKACIPGCETLERTSDTDLKATAAVKIGPIAAPDVIQWAPGLPKTRSGKIMRRILRKIAENELSSLGDTSTLADPSVFDDLVKNRAG